MRPCPIFPITIKNPAAYACALGLCLVLTNAVALNVAVAEEESKPAAAQEQTETPLAGEEYQAELFGHKIEVPPRDRRHVTAANLGVQWIPNGPTFYEILPFGSLYIWHNWTEERKRLRATIALAFNDIQYTVGSKSGWETLLTFQNIIIPFGRSEYVEGQRITEVDVEWNQVYGGVGIGYRVPLAPGHQDSAIEMTLTYEPGYLWFKRSSATAPSFKTPSDTYEHRVRFKMRADALDRNLMELPHRGFSGGADVLYGHRTHWGDWGGVAFDSPDFKRERDYVALSAYFVVAGAVPFVESEKHRIVAELHGGIGKDLDRFSAFRLPGRPLGYEWESLSRPIMPGVAFFELFPTRYGITNVTYRYEALFFLYPYIRGTWGWVERPRFQANGQIKNQVDTLPALGGGVVSGAPWRSQIELNYSYNFGIFRDPGGNVQQGGHGFFIFWSKELGRCATKLLTLSDC